MKQGKPNNILLLVLCLLICYAAGALGSLATIPQIGTWYAGLKKPFFNPPNQVFGPVWSLLYTLMAISLFLVIRKPYPGKQVILRIFFLQLLANTLWSFFFFYFHFFIVSILDILFLLLLLFSYFRRVRRVNRFAAYCFLPYICWVSFATVLNISLWWLNR
jgi:tryptophan-rich sensory protein